MELFVAALLALELQARPLDGASAAAHYQQGLAAARKNDLNAARAEYERATAAKPATPQAKTPIKK